MIKQRKFICLLFISFSHIMSNSFEEITYDLNDLNSLRFQLLDLKDNINICSSIDYYDHNNGARRQLSEITQPLARLALTLENLGNFFTNQSLYVPAQLSLERACPILDLVSDLRDIKTENCFHSLKDVYQHSEQNYPEESIPHQMKKLLVPFQHLKLEFWLKHKIETRHQNIISSETKQTLYTFLAQFEGNEIMHRLSIISQNLFSELLMDNNDENRNWAEAYLDLIHQYIWDYKNSNGSSFYVPIHDLNPKNLSVIPSNISTSLKQNKSNFPINFAHDVSKIIPPLPIQSTTDLEFTTSHEFPPPTQPLYIRDIIKWQYLMSNLKSTPSIHPIPRPPTITQANIKNQQYLTSHFVIDQIVPSVYDPLSSPQNQPPRTAVTTVQANKSAVLALTLFFVALLGVFGVLVYSNTNSSFSIRRKQKRITKKNKWEQFQDYLITSTENLYWLIKVIFNPSIFNDLKTFLFQSVYRLVYPQNKKYSSSNHFSGKFLFLGWSFPSLLKTCTSLIFLIWEFFYNSFSLLLYFLISYSNSSLSSISTNNKPEKLINKDTTSTISSNTNNSNNNNNNKEVHIIKNNLNKTVDDGDNVVKDTSLNCKQMEPLLSEEKEKSSFIENNSTDNISRLEIKSKITTTEIIINTVLTQFEVLSEEKLSENIINKYDNNDNDNGDEISNNLNLIKINSNLDNNMNHNSNPSISQLSYPSQLNIEITSETEIIQSISESQLDQNIKVHNSSEIKKDISKNVVGIEIPENIIPLCSDSIIPKTIEESLVNNTSISTSPSSLSSLSSLTSLTISPPVTSTTLIQEISSENISNVPTITENTNDKTNISTTNLTPTIIVSNRSKKIEKRNESKNSKKGSELKSNKNNENKPIIASSIENNPIKNSTTPITSNVSNLTISNSKPKKINNESIIKIINSNNNSNNNVKKVTKSSLSDSTQQKLILPIIDSKPSENQLNNNNNQDDNNDHENNNNITKNNDENMKNEDNEKNILDQNNKNKNTNYEQQQQEQLNTSIFFDKDFEDDDKNIIVNPQLNLNEFQTIDKSIMFEDENDSLCNINEEKIENNTFIITQNSIELNYEILQHENIMISEKSPSPEIITTDTLNILQSDDISKISNSIVSLLEDLNKTSEEFIDNNTTSRLENQGINFPSQLSISRPTKSFNFNNEYNYDNLSLENTYDVQNSLLSGELTWAQQFNEFSKFEYENNNQISSNGFNRKTTSRSNSIHSDSSSEHGNLDIYLQTPENGLNNVSSNEYIPGSRTYTTPKINQSFDHYQTMHDSTYNDIIDDDINFNYKGSYQISQSLPSSSRFMNSNYSYQNSYDNSPKVAAGISNISTNHPLQHSPHSSYHSHAQHNIHNNIPPLPPSSYSSISHLHNQNQNQQYNQQRNYGSNNLLPPHRSKKIPSIPSNWMPGDRSTYSSNSNSRLNWQYNGRATLNSQLYPSNQSNQSMSSSHYHNINNSHTSLPMELSPNIKITFTVRCIILPPSKVSQVKIASSLFGRWSTADSLPMRSSHINPEIWGLTIEIPKDIPRFLYQYLLVDLNGRLLIEPGQPRFIGVGENYYNIIGNINQEDLFEHGIQSVHDTYLFT